MVRERSVEPSGRSDARWFWMAAELSLMLLLGIRSVVRRVVTLVVRKGDITAGSWQEIAFNLRELRLRFHRQVERTGGGGAGP